MHDVRRSRSCLPIRALTAVLVAAGVLALSLAPMGVAGAVNSDPTSGLRGVEFSRLAHDVGDVDAPVQIVRSTHGDIDGDGDEDAAVVLSFQQNERPYWVVQTYRNDDGTAVVSGRTHQFNADWEHFDRLLITGGIIEFTVASGQNEATGWLTTHRWDLIGGDMRLLETISSGSLLTLTRGGSQPAMPGYTRSAFVDVAPDAVEASFWFETDERESVQLQSDDPDASLRIYSAQTLALVSVIDTASIATLPSGGSWIGVPVVSSERSVRLLLTVADQRALYAPQLSVRMYEDGRDSTEPHRSVSLAWHEVTWAHGDVDLELVNGHIREFVAEIEREHRAAAAACPDGTDATLYVGSTPRLVSYDLVSFEFSIASCLCELNDEVRYRSLTIDLPNAKVLDTSDLLPGSLEAASLAWWSEISEYRDWIVDSELFEPVGSPVTFSSISIDPWGVELTVRGSDLANDLQGPVTVHLDWDELDGMVDPAVRTRAESGQDVVLPSDGCGC